MCKIDQLEAALTQREVRIAAPMGRAHAAVALMVTEGADGDLNVLLIERATNEDDFWSGQIGLPGGRMETSDNNSKHTAEREVREELGVDLSCARHLGRLSDLVPDGLNIIISPFVYAVPEDMNMAPDREEVADILWFPLEELKNPRRCSNVMFHSHGRVKKFPSLLIKDEKERHLWGITYRLLRNLNKIIPKVLM
ncbi:ADP-ribose pyrophosphatase YjhB, NUDIX family [Geobacter sp. DSM 9736]|nr:ADP-ribose pyrophosphatase YjhB, NUDIX family [Geobacter sp. DSM 9736]